QMNHSNLYRLFKRLDATRLPWGRTTSIKKQADRRGFSISVFHVAIIDRKRSPSRAFVAFDEEKGDVFAFYAKATPENAARLVRMLVARFDNISGICAPYEEPF